MFANLPELQRLLNAELARERDEIELIASENYVSRDVLAAAGSVLTNKYAEGFPGKRYYDGCNVVDEIETNARLAAQQLFGCAYADVQPHSGSNANAIAYLALLKPGDCVLAMGLDQGGHLTHGSPVSFSGKIYDFKHYGVDQTTHRLDYAQVHAIARAVKPKLIVCGASNYSRVIDFAKFRAIADDVNAFLMADVAHIAGLIVTKQHPSPFPWCDVVTSTTHKTLRGPRGGLVLANNPETIKKLRAASFPGMQGGPLQHVIAAKWVAFHEAAQPAFYTYIKNVINNAGVFCAALKKHGFFVVANSTDNHLFCVDTFRSFGITGDQVSQWLYAAGIVANKNTVPYDPNPPQHPSGVRFGSAAMTTRGFTANDFVEVASWINAITRSKGDREVIADIRAKVTNKLAGFPLYPGLAY